MTVLSRLLQAAWCRYCKGMSTVTTEPDDGPLPLRLAVLALWIETVLVAALAVFQLVEVFTASPADPGVALGLSLATGGLAIVLYRLGALLTQRRSWPRGAAIVLQLMALPVAFFMVTGEGGIVVAVAGLILGAYCLTCAVLLLVPNSRL